MEFKIGDIVVVTYHYKNGAKSRRVGYITYLEDIENSESKRVILSPLPRELATKIREKYLEDFKYCGAKNDYSDSFGFASSTINKDNSVIIGNYTKPLRPIWSPSPGNVHYDLMC